MHLLSLNAAGKPLAPARVLDRKRRRLSQVLGRHVDRRRPHMVAVQRASDPLQPIDEAWVERGFDKNGKVKPWPRTYLPADAIVVVVYLPRGGGGAAGGSSRSKSPLSIALGIAAVALIAFAGPIGGVLAGAVGLGGSTFAVSAITAGVAIGGSVLLSLASRAKADKQATDTTQIYGITGGGNLPKPGDRIPRGYGRSWMKPDLSQADSSQYDGDDLIAFKRHTIGVGRYRPYAVRAGKQIVWREGEGFVAPFNDPRNQIEFIYGTPSTLVPNNIIAATGIGGPLPRPAENPSVAGPFLINQRGALVNRLQIDFQFPQGIARTDFLKSGATRANQPGAWAVYFEYAPIDETGRIIGPWDVLYNGNSGAEGARFSTHPLRYTRFKDVPPGRYAVRGRNVQPDSTENTTGNATVDAAQWDAAAGWVNDSAVRPGITEMCLRLYATKGTQAASFAELEVDACAILPVWNGNAWVEQETRKAVWAFADVMRNQDYGGALLDSQLDVGTMLAYANRLTQFDTFDATIRGPVSVLEAASTVLLPMRAEPVHVGRFWSLVRDEPKAVRKHVITPRQMTKGSTQVLFDLDTEAGAGHVIGEFDKDGDYRSPDQTSAIFGEASLTPTRLKWTGVRDYAHANHLTKWRAACGAFRRQSTPFGVEMEGRIYKRGDSILVDPWFLETRRRAGVVDNRGDTLILDCNVDQLPTDVVVLRDRQGQAWGPVVLLESTGPREIRLNPISRAQVESNTGQSLGAVLSTARQEMTTVLLGTVSSVTENYLIQSVRMNGPGSANVEALYDDQRVWEVLGAPIVVPPVGEGGLRDPESPRIVALTANATPVAAGYRCDYAIKPGQGAVRFEVGISYDDGNRFDSRPDAPITGSIELNPVDPQMVVVRARAFGASGMPGPYYLTELALPRATLNSDLPPIRYEDLEPDILSRIAEILAADARLQEIFVGALNRANQAFIRADEAFAQAFGLAGAISGNAAAIVAEQQTRLTADEAFATDLNAAVVRLGNTEAGILTERTARITADSAQASSLDAVKVQQDSDRAFIVRENNARITNEGVQASQIETLRVNADNLTGFVIRENNARITKDDVQAQQIDGVVAAANSDRSYFIAVTDTLAAFSGIYGSRIETLGAQYGDLNTQIIEERRVRADGDGVQAQRTNALVAQVDSDRGYFLSVTNTLIGDRNVLIQQTIDLYARSDSGTAAGRFQMEVRSGPGGVTSRIAALLSTSRGGQTYGAGYFLDLMNDGTSRFVIDAGAFYITNGGDGIPLLSFDGFTLRVPNLQVTSANIPAGVVNYPGRTDIYNYTLIAGAGTNNNAVDGNMRHVFYSEGNYPTIISLRGHFTARPSSALLGMNLIVDGAFATTINGGTMQTQGNTEGRDFDGVAVLFVSAGFHTAQFRYSYQGGNAGSGIVIDEIHMATVTARA